jgi:hypothetical protein
MIEIVVIAFAFLHLFPVVLLAPEDERRELGRNRFDVPDVIIVRGWLTNN